MDVKSTPFAQTPLGREYARLRSENPRLTEAQFNQAELRASDSKSALRVKVGQACITSLAARQAHQKFAYERVKSIFDSWVDPGGRGANSLQSFAGAQAWSGALGSRREVRLADLSALHREFESRRPEVPVPAVSVGSTINPQEFATGAGVSTPDDSEGVVDWHQPSNAPEDSLPTRHSTLSSSPPVALPGSLKLPGKPS
jgi:hypothetical protein